MAGRYTLMTENSIAKKSSSCHVQVLDIPSEPRNLKISEVQAESLCLSWKQPSDNGGTIISHYRIERIAKSDQQWKPIALSHKKTNMLVKYLIEGETYKFRVFAENCFGMGPYTETEDVIATKPIHVPSMPQNLEIAEIDKNSISLTWQKPGRDGGSPVSAYRVEYCTEEELKWETFDIVSTFRCTVTNLEESVPYKFRIRAINAAGEGRPDTTIAVTPTQKLTSPSVEIDIKLLEGMTCRAGSTITIPALIYGTPAPTITWANRIGDELIPDE